MAFRHRGKYIPQGPTKDPNSRIQYSSDWSDELVGEVIVQSSWVVPDGLVGDGTDLNGSVTAIWLKGGVAGQKYRLTNRIVTDTGREDDRSMIIPCAEK